MNDNDKDKDKDKDGLFAASEVDEDEFGGFEMPEFGSVDDDAGEAGASAAGTSEPIESAAPENAETPAAPVEPAKDSETPSEPKPARKRRRPRLVKKGKVPMTKRQKVVRLMMRRAGIRELPDIDVLLRCKAGARVAIKEIGLFTGVPSDEVLAEMAAECPVKNRVNLSAELTKNRVVFVGAEILTAGRMYQPIQVARITEDGSLECTSGRHRLAFLALVYGTDAQIPVYVEEMTLNEARDAVVVANQARPTKAMERAEHACLQAVSGDVSAKQEQLFASTATTKAKARKYCVYSVMRRSYPASLTFAVSPTSSRKDGSLTTLTNIENFWSAALDWHKGISRVDFDAALKESVSFLNELAKELQKQSGFDANHHMAAMTLKAVGKYYRSYQEITGKGVTPLVGLIAECIVKMGEIGRQKSEKTFQGLSKFIQENTKSA